MAPPPPLVNVAPPMPHLLVADNDPNVLEVLTRGLRGHGFDVSPASGGRAAVALFHRHAATISLVLLNVLMPHLDGPRTLAALRQIDPDVPCCFISGSLGGYSADELLAMGHPPRREAVPPGGTRRRAPRRGRHAQAGVLALRPQAPPDLGEQGLDFHRLAEQGARPEGGGPSVAGVADVRHEDDRDGGRGRHPVPLG
jgi:CheY-like chemotaxis protein